MAAIIAQLTLANRERKRRALKHIHSTKCTYQLQPFHPHGFDPRIHNRYLMERERYRNMCQAMEEEERMWQEIYRTELVSRFSGMR